ncbi:MAG: biotin--[acetyl-CoA-carboxylase] ligase [Candidatus Omnitrophica bacterium CG12_big_fil_rev_8_21_14_0_65_43_15]|uniref:Bifunctional ligase/repressor BirA n=1 Tax=Candidatus Taenaricola geysiri TaxID=1974752 RepID=A0A2J0LIW5_9BACT|nr:MAG: biotin--[acetyl-CoA-carboxylase] ligase [Candidatus Omnitrophica bacterium CG10_big_fil_rev_8_21_14_0_10_43_8]PIW65980.1 MAG: biotin--[acetyl-CoA-carboxylase] ligase [Candidatus Omnitrophica bacterium CG12_big_fil_rev_8_21_14_0_65_43_15]PIW79669.1 MAG: biotin--[acetyl-CoA-carboxylase] ligase [Candidatus Omnitrophica bacterium CG_4_8_14_3_um_filter_43_15]PIY83436.1 MAG: biotin--[acetyl-CoA-carboxylase] ligase [Candidatus Omnitrophica bacterium CG_4_10_14_0_8_um_filter_43_18]PJC46854.1 MA
MDEKILNVFRKYPDQYISGEDLSEELGVSRTAIWKHIEELRKIGYIIEAEPHSGYKLVSAPDRLLSSEISAGLDTKIIGKNILSFDTVDSTMDVAYDFAVKGTGEGVCVFAEGQKKGRGRMNRDWQSPKHKGVYLSLILRPEISPNEISKITLMVAVSVAKTIRAKTGLSALIKWPNDILIDGRKVCGILTDMSAESDIVKFLVIGIGININSKIQDLPDSATSLREFFGEKVDRIDFTRALLEELDSHYLDFMQQGFGAILEEWRNFSATLGSRVKVDFKNRHIEGQAMDVDESGALLVRLDNGFIERILSGDVILAR